MNKVESYIWTTYEPVLETEGLEFSDVVYKKEGASFFLRLFIDHLDRSPVTIEDCEKVSRTLNDLMDQDPGFPIDKAYILEVSSPGIERPLKRLRDFHKFKGEMVRIRLYQAFEGQKNLVGILGDADEEKVTLIVDGESLQLAYKDIAKANLYFEF